MRVGAGALLLCLVFGAMGCGGAGSTKSAAERCREYVVTSCERSAACGRFATSYVDECERQTDAYLACALWQECEHDWSALNHCLDEVRGGACGEIMLGPPAVCRGTVLDQPACSTEGPVVCLHAGTYSTGHGCGGQDCTDTCQITRDDCSDGKHYEVDCDITTGCTCSVDGVTTAPSISDFLCDAPSLVDTACGWSSSTPAPR